MSDNLARVTQFPKSYPEETLSSSTTTRAPARVEEVLRYYGDAFGVAAPPRVAREVTSLLSDGVDADMLLEIIDEASVAPRPSWCYARAIISRCLAEGVKTCADYYERQIRWKYLRH